MKFTDLSPMISTEDVESTIDFYTSILGFTCDEYNDEWGWASLSRDNVQIMVSRPNDHIPFERPIFTGTFYITIENVDALWDLLKDTPYVFYSIENFHYGMREFAIKDNNGYIIQFGQSIL